MYALSIVEAHHTPNYHLLITPFARMIHLKNEQQTEEGGPLKGHRWRLFGLNNTLFLLVCNFVVFGGFDNPMFVLQITRNLL
ncbi:hypothetical protein AQUCO_02400076v1 [Aquilegia coerulea]|uniref:Uncharacterized protein n=1 Tax=Aquilegia coerulea TaxID=218851 RepID=A0A2G5DC09_AQUCA|nr:hypothetical protein AQUCO_02400076v1 [Aquilegia coerulea]